VRGSRRRRGRRPLRALESRVDRPARTSPRRLQQADAGSRGAGRGPARPR
jgi:hypothetical protein